MEIEYQSRSQRCYAVLFSNLIGERHKNMALQEGVCAIGCPICLKFFKPFCPKNMSFQSMKCLVFEVFRVFLHHLKFPPVIAKITKDFEKL